MGALKHKVDDFPLHYGLTPEQSKEIATTLHLRKKLTYTGVQTLATKYRVAAKTIHQFCTKIKVDIIPDPVSMPKKVKPTQKQQNILKAEAAFKKPEPAPAPKSKLHEMKLEDDALMMLIEMEEKMKQDQAEALAAIQLLEEETNKLRQEAHDATERAAAQRERAEAAIQQTRRLRESTKDDRVSLEATQSALNTVSRQYKVLLGRTELVYEELRESVKREQRLLDALKVSESDLASCRETCK